MVRVHNKTDTKLEICTGYVEYAGAEPDSFGGYQVDVAPRQEIEILVSKLLAEFIEERRNQVVCVRYGDDMLCWDHHKFVEIEEAGNVLVIQRGQNDKLQYVMAAARGYRRNSYGGWWIFRPAGAQELGPDVLA